MRKEPNCRTRCVFVAACQADYSGVYRGLPESGNATKRYILTWDETMKEVVKSNCHSTVVTIHFSFDLWSGPNQHEYQAVVPHWLDRQSRLHAVLLYVHRFLGPLSGEMD
jgi:hypothetical protein